MIQFFETIQEKVLRGKCIKNSVLIVSDCEKGWLGKREQLDNENIQRALRNCNGECYEFSLRFDRQDDDSEDREKNSKRRKESIDALVSFLNGKSFSKIDLSHVQTEEFQNEWYVTILPIFFRIMEQAIRVWTQNSAPILREVSSLAVSEMRNQCRTM